MLVIKKPHQIMNIKKIMIFLLFSLLAIISFIEKKYIKENEIIQNLIQDLYDADIIKAEQFDYLSNNNEIIIVGILSIISTLLLFKLIYNFIYVKKIKYIFDFENKNLAIEEGIFQKYKDGINFENIADIDISQSFFEMIFKRHTIKLYTKGDMSKQNLKNFTREERKNIQEINQNIEFGYVGFKKIISISEAEMIFDKIRLNLTH